MSVEILSTPSEATAAVPTLPVYRLTSSQYWRMVRAGILTKKDKVELLEGWIIPKMTKHQPHCISSGSVYDAILRVLPAGWYVAREEPFIATAHSTPEPDVMVVRGGRNDYPVDPPGAADVPLVIEVSESSLQKDLVQMMRIYAQAAIPIYWVVNLPARRIEVYSGPTGPAREPAYRRREEFGPEDEIPLILAGGEVARLAVRDLLPRRGG